MDTLAYVIDLIVIITVMAVLRGAVIDFLTITVIVGYRVAVIIHCMFATLSLVEKWLNIIQNVQLLFEKRKEKRSKNEVCVCVLGEGGGGIRLMNGCM